jgi:hypothetical protein
MRKRGLAQPREPQWLQRHGSTAASSNESFLKSFVLDGCHYPNGFVEIETAARSLLRVPRPPWSPWLKFGIRQCQRALLPRLQRREFKAAAERQRMDANQLIVCSASPVSFHTGRGRAATSHLLLLGAEP